MQLPRTLFIVVSVARSAPRRDTASSEEPRAPLPSSGFTTPVSTRSPDGIDVVCTVLHG